MTILIIGRTGQVAQTFAEAVVGSDRFTFWGRDALDLENIANIRDAILSFSPEMVINLAAYTNVDKAEDEPDLANTVNGFAVGEMAEACNTLDIPLIHISTDYVFDGKADTPYFPEDVINPQNAYGRSKALGEALIQARCTKYYILRTSWVYSEFGKNFYKTMQKLMAERESVSVVNDQIGRPTHTKAIVSVLMQLVNFIDEKRSENSEYGIYHVAGPQIMTWYDFALEIKTKEGLSAAVVPVSSSNFLSKVERPKYSVLECSKLNMLLDK